MTKEKAKVEAVIDSNEAAVSDAIDYIRKHPSVSAWYVDDLKTGDIILSDEVIVEIKSPSDFASALQEDRLKEQALRMSDSDYTKKYILIRGNLEDFENLEHTNIKPESLKGMMASISVRYGVEVVPVGDMENLVDMAVRYTRKVLEEPSSATPMSSSVTSKDVPQTVRIIASIDGVGETAAWNLYSKFENVSNIIQATPEEIQSVPMVGEERQKAVTKSLTEE